MFENKIKKVQTKPMKNVHEQINPSMIQSSDIDINEVIKQIKDKIIGQDESIEAVASTIYANQGIIETGIQDLISAKKTSILLDGPTGTGKTTIIKEVADRLSLPAVITNLTEYSITGYVGKNLTDILVNLLEKANGSLELSQRGIVCLDEIDKLVHNLSDDDEFIKKMKATLQQELLTFISGTKFNVEYNGKTIEFDTSNLTFIGIGTFTKLREQNTNNTYVMTAQDYIDLEVENKLISRFSLLTSTKAYSVEDYKNILIKSSISPLKMFIEFAKSFDVSEVTYDEDFIQMMAEMAYEDNLGVIGLQKIVSNLKNFLLLDIMSSKSKTINLTTEMLKKSEEKNIRSF